MIMFFIVPSPDQEAKGNAPRSSTSSEPHRTVGLADVNAYYRRRVAAAYVLSAQTPNKFQEAYENSVATGVD
jgi:hypothetical protein